MWKNFRSDREIRAKLVLTPLGVMLSDFSAECYELLMTQSTLGMIYRAGADAILKPVDAVVMIN